MRIRCPTIFEIQKYSIHSILQLYWIHCNVAYLLSDFLFSIQRINGLSDFRCIIRFYLCKSCWYSLKHLFKYNILIPLPFCCLLKARIISTIFTSFSGFLFSGIYFLSTEFLKSINPSLILFTNFSFLSCSALIKSLTKNNGFWYLK